MGIFLNPCVWQWDSFSLIFFRETACLLTSVEGKKIIKYFASHSLKTHCHFQPLILLQWKYKTHFLWSTATQTLGKSCGISKYHGTIFFSFFISLCTRPLCPLRLYVSIHDCKTCTHHQPTKVVRTAWKSTWVLGGACKLILEEGKAANFWKWNGVKCSHPTG